MCTKKIFLLIAINIIPLFFIWFHLDDIYRIFVEKKEDYPFGSEFFLPYSIYRSQTTYVLYSLVTLVCLLALIASSITQRKKIYFILLFVSILLIVYPLLTNE